MSTTDQTPDNPFAIDPASMQAELIELELWRIRREMLHNPALVKLNIGAGNPAEQTIRGDPRDRYNGVVIYNPTPLTVLVGFQAGLGVLAPATVPPYSWAAFPQTYVNLSIATSANDPALNSATPSQWTMPSTITVVRTRITPAAGGGSYGLPGLAPVPPIWSLLAQTGVQAGVALDNAVPRSNHSMSVFSGPGVTGGVLALQASNNNTDWVTLGTVNTNAANAAFPVTATGPFRWLRAAITTAIVGGYASGLIAST